MPSSAFVYTLIGYTHWFYGDLLGPDFCDALLRTVAICGLPRTIACRVNPPLLLRMQTFQAPCRTFFRMCLQIYWLRAMFWMEIDDPSY